VVGGFEEELNDLAGCDAENRERDLIGEVESFVAKGGCDGEVAVAEAFEGADDADFGEGEVVFRAAVDFESGGWRGEKEGRWGEEVDSGCLIRGRT